MDELTLVKGRPITREYRLPEETLCYDLLDELNIEYYRVDHEPAENMELCRRIDEVMGAEMCKNLFLCNRQMTQHYLLMMPGDKPFKTKLLSKQLGVARLSFGVPEKMYEYLRIKPGAVSVMGLMNDTENNVRLIVDKDLLKSEYIGCHPCVCTSSLKLKTDDVFNVIAPHITHDVTYIELVDTEEN